MKIIAVILACAAALSGCGSLSTLQAMARLESSEPKINQVLVHPAPRIASQAEFDFLVGRFATMALFSKVVYRHDIPEETRIGAGCAYLNGASEDFGMPRSAGEANWVRMRVNGVQRGSDRIYSCFDRDGLYYETYGLVDADQVERPDPRPRKIVIAIRGTENYEVWEQLRDWEANFSAAMDKDPDQYRTARVQILPLIAHLHETYPAVPIVVTGHSLGGGIAQQIAYASEHVHEAVVFDTSPVTNWSQLARAKPKSLVAKTYPTIHRINHLNEFLALPRFIATRLTTTRLERSDYDFSFQTEKKVDSHEMGILACHLIVRMNTATAEFPLSFAKKVISLPSICPGGEGKVKLPDELVLAAMQR